MTNTSRIAKNTLMLYFRQILILLVSLYTVRAVLEALGAQDYGIYNVVAGVVTMFGFLSGAMATASQRYFSYELGRGDTEALEKTFGVTLSIYVLLIAVIFVLAQTAGLWFVLEKLVIPAERKTAAVWVYEFAVVSFAVTLITAPYMAAIIAHEDMGVYARVSIAEAALKLAVVFALQVIPCDRLAAYGGLLLSVALINTALYRAHCRRRYAECRFRLRWDKALFKEMASYSGWNLFGSLVGVSKNQCINILLNQFFNPIVNASRAIAAQVNTAVSSFSQNFSTAMRPQIIKTYAAGEYDQCIHIVFYGCKITFFLMYAISLPLVLEMPFVLQLWLKTPPESASLFTQLALIDVLVDSISFPIMTLAQATGKIKLYQSVVGGVILLNLPISYIVLYMGYPAVSVMVIAVFITVFAFIIRLLIIKKLVRFSLRLFLLRVLFPLLGVAVLSAIGPILLTIFISNEIIEFISVVFASVILCGFLILFIGLNKSERHRVFTKFKERKFFYA